MRKLSIVFVCLLLSILACVRSQPEIVVITATFAPGTGAPDSVPSASPFPAGFTFATPTPDPTRPSIAVAVVTEYIVQPGDTLTAIAAEFEVSVEALLALNSLDDPNSLIVGQVLQLPDAPQEVTNGFKVIPDSRLVRGPGSSAFDVQAFVEQQQGYIRSATDEVNGERLTGAQIVQRVALEYSVDPRLLLALLEYKGGWLTNPNPSDEVKTYPLGAQASPLGFDRNGLYRQLTWAADQLNAGYYGWKLRGLTTLEFSDGTRLRFNPELNAATVGVQHLLSLYNDPVTWSQQVTADGFYQTYISYFGDPFVGAVEPLVPGGLAQPALTLPFSSGQTWFYTGGPHGGWGSGSAWAAVDFAPPDERPDGSSTCYVSDYFVTASAAGVVARSGEGTVVLDLDSDGDETTGWTILYLHLATIDRAPVGTVIELGDPLGHPSCEGGLSSGAHLHIARRYNGEWIPADCQECLPGQERPPFVLDGWTAIGYVNQEYQGALTNGSEQRVAEQGRLDPNNRVTRP